MRSKQENKFTMELSVPKIPEPLIIWEKIEILTSTDSNAGLYVARIEDFVDDGIVITNPELIKGEILLRDNCEVILQITKTDAIYQFHSIIKKSNTNGISKFYLSNPIFNKRIQRRNFVRVVYSTLVEYTIFSETYNEKQKWYKSYSWDISGNGILIETKDFVKQDSLILLKIQLLDDLKVKIPVLGRAHRILLDNKTRLSGVGFIPTTEMSGFVKNYPIQKIKNLQNSFNKVAQEKLVSFVFNQQILKRKEGL